MTTARFCRDEPSTAMALRLIAGLAVMPADVEDWSDAQIQQAEEWAGAVHIQKTIPSVDAPPMPRFLNRYVSDGRKAQA